MEWFEPFKGRIKITEMNVEWVKVQVIKAILDAGFTFVNDKDGNEVMVPAIFLDLEKIKGKGDPQHSAIHFNIPVKDQWNDVVVKMLKLDEINEINVNFEVS